MGYEFGNSKLINGVAWGVVAKNVHPTGAYMVRCKLPWVKSTDAKDDEDFLTTWCRVLTPLAGGGRGFYCLPEEGDEVLLAFVHGNMRQPVVLGSVWNDTDKIPHGADAPADSEDPMGNALGIADATKDNKKSDGKNNARFFISRSGSTMLFDDTAGKEKIAFFTAKGTMLNLNDEKETIAIYDHSKEVYLVMDAANKKITLETVTGDIDFFCKKGTFNVEAKFITMYSEKDTDHKADGKWKQESGGTMDLKAGGTQTTKAPKIDLNP